MHKLLITIVLLWLILFPPASSSAAVCQDKPASTIGDDSFLGKYATSACMVHCVRSSTAVQFIEC